MKRITVRIESEEYEAGDYNRKTRDCIAELCVEVDDQDAWSVYGNAVRYLTAPTVTTDVLDERIGW